MKLLTINAKLPIRFLVLFAAGFVDKRAHFCEVQFSLNYRKHGLIHNILVSLYSHLCSVLGKILSYNYYHYYTIIQKLYRLK